ncbi:MAG: hypothetical protein Q8O33_10805 [Pseudomonadota bacterium]|nr:hypothetical protein [Pseudomonadota bacterium]
MAQHFLLFAAARTISVLEVATLSDDNAFALFKRLRWGDQEEVGCPPRLICSHDKPLNYCETAGIEGPP